MSGHETVEPEQERRIADRYRLTGVLGSGGAGTVWAAVDEVLGREVAVKDVVIPPWLSDEERRLARERTLREARAACRIDHPNVVDVYDVVEQDGRPWIVMRLLKAPSLADVIDRDGPCSPAWAARIGLQVLGALQAAHAHGIMHRDVKPSNVMVDRGRAVLTDFGIATIDGESTLTSPDALVGAPSYIAPERVRGEPATPASDLWSLGATMYAAVEGHPPHVREGVLAILTAVATDEPDPVQRAGPLAPLLSALLRKDPALRPTAVEVEQHLRRVIALTDDPAATTVTGVHNAAARTTTINRVALGEQTSGRRAVAAAGGASTASNPVPGPAPRRRRTPVLAGTAVVLLAIALAGLLYLPTSLPGSPSQGEQTGDLPSIAPAPSSSTEVEDEPVGSRNAGDRPADNPGPSPAGQPTSTVRAPAPTSEEPTVPTPTGTQEPPPPTTTTEPPPTTTTTEDTQAPTTAEETTDPA